MSEPDNSIEIRNLSIRFASREIIGGLDLDIPRTGVTILLGSSGSGKTTLLRAINRLNECFPACHTSGDIRLRLGGRWVDAYDGDLPIENLRRKAAMVFQNPNVLPTSIERNFTIPMQSVFAGSASERRDRMEAALREAGLFDEVKDRLHDSAATLSGGQQQRLCLARALALEPDILLLDEPTANLDFVATRKIEALLEKLQEKYTILAVSHSLGQTRRIASQVALLQSGSIARILDRVELDDGTIFQELIENGF